MAHDRFTKFGTKRHHGAAAVAETLGGRRVGTGWMARCPAHSDRTPSLSIRDAEDGKLLLHCHAGCSHMQVIAALDSRVEDRRPAQKPIPA
jgi:hypothetical protein